MTKLRTPRGQGERGVQRERRGLRGTLRRVARPDARSPARGGEKARKRHEERGKLLVRDRIARLLDPDTAFLELSPLAALGMYDGEVPAVGKVKINEIGEGTSEINRQIIARSLLREVDTEKAREEVAVQ